LSRKIKRAKQSIPYEIDISLTSLRGKLKLFCKGGGIGMLSRPDLMVKPNKSFVNIVCPHIGYQPMPSISPGTSKIRNKVSMRIGQELIISDPFKNLSQLIGKM